MRSDAAAGAIGTPGRARTRRSRRTRNAGASRSAGASEPAAQSRRQRLARTRKNLAGPRRACGGIGRGGGGTGRPGAAGGGSADGGTRPRRRRRQTRSARRANRRMNRSTAAEHGGRSGIARGLLSSSPLLRHGLQRLAQQTRRCAGFGFRLGDFAARRALRRRRPRVAARRRRRWRSLATRRLVRRFGPALSSSCSSAAAPAPFRLSGQAAGHAIHRCSSGAADRPCLRRSNWSG